MVKIYEPTAGKVIFDGEDITKIKGAKLKEFRRDMQMIFQDPYASLNPRTVSYTHLDVYKRQLLKQIVMLVVSL